MGTIPLSQALAADPTLPGDLRFACVAQTNLSAGTPVAINRSNNKLIQADASYKPSAFVRGILSADVLAGFTGSVAVLQFALANWTAIIGTQFLSPGQPYFLQSGGGMSTTPPGGGVCIALIGVALDQTTLQISPQTPIQM